MNLFAQFLNAFLLAVVLIICLRQPASDLRLVDYPDAARKHHNGAIPLCGGLAIFTAFMAASVTFPGGFQLPWNMQFGLILLVLLGMADDRWRISARFRLFAQTLTALLLICGAGFGPLNMGQLEPSGAWLLGAVLGTAIAVFFVVGMVNSFNMLDGVDGLAGGSAVAILFWLVLMAIHLGDGPVTLHATVLMAAVLGFLIFNMRHPWRMQASVFMGDAGSVMLGAAIAYFVIALSSGPHGVAFPVLIWLVILPVTDTLSLIVRRLAAHRSPLSPDRWHMHHLLVDSGVSPSQAAAILTVATALCGAIGYAGILFSVPDIVMTVGLALPIMAHTIFVCFVIAGAQLPEQQRRMGKPASAAARATLLVNRKG